MRFPRALAVVLSLAQIFFSCLRTLYPFIYAAQLNNNRFGSISNRKSDRTNYKVTVLTVPSVVTSGQRPLMGYTDGANTFIAPLNVSGCSSKSSHNSSYHRLLSPRLCTLRLPVTCSALAQGGNTFFSRTLSSSSNPLMIGHNLYKGDIYEIIIWKGYQLTYGSVFHNHMCNRSKQGKCTVQWA